MPLTVGDLRKAISGLPDDAPVYPDWALGKAPSDSEPGVELFAVKAASRETTNDHPYLSIEVGLFYLDDDADDQDESCRCGLCDQFADDVESTFCGSMCGECRAQHAKDCEVCRDDFIERGLIDDLQPPPLAVSGDNEICGGCGAHHDTEQHANDCPNFDPADCGGSFDGFSVTSDADPGL